MLHGPSHNRQAYAVQDTWTRFSPAGVEHLCHADVWNERHLVQHHYFSAFVAFQAACRQQIAWMHHLFLDAQAWVVDLHQSAPNTCVQHCTPVETSQQNVGGLSGLLGPSAPGVVAIKTQEINASNFSKKESDERLRRLNPSSQDIFCSRTAVQNAADWAVEFLSWQHTELARAGITACDTTTAGHSGSPGTLTAHSNGAVSKAPKAVDGPPVCCQSMPAEDKVGMDWLALSGVGLHQLSEHSGATTSSIRDSMDGLRSALLAVLQADAASEYHGNTSTGNTNRADVGVRCRVPPVYNIVACFQLL